MKRGMCPMELFRTYTEPDKPVVALSPETFHFATELELSQPLLD